MFAFIDKLIRLVQVGFWFVLLLCAVLLVVFLLLARYARQDGKRHWWAHLLPAGLSVGLAAFTLVSLFRPESVYTLLYRDVVRELEAAYPQIDTRTVEKLPGDHYVLQVRVSPDAAAEERETLLDAYLHTARELLEFRHFDELTGEWQRKTGQDGLIPAGQIALSDRRLGVAVRTADGPEREARGSQSTGEGAEGFEAVYDRWAAARTEGSA